jgi:hypothetical protein
MPLPTSAKNSRLLLARIGSPPGKDSGSDISHRWMAYYV